MQEKKESGALRKEREWGVKETEKIVWTKSGDAECSSGWCIQKSLNYDFGKHYNR